jgi:hypothetical protein
MSSIGSNAVKTAQFPARVVLLTAAVVSVFFLAAYFVLFRLEGGAIAVPDSQRSITQNALFQNRVTIASVYVTLARMTVVTQVKNEPVVLATMEALQSDVAAVAEYGISRQTVENFWKNYKTLGSDETVKTMSWANRTDVELNMALAGAAFIELYSQDFAQDRIDRLKATAALLNSFDFKREEGEPSDAVKAQIGQALSLLQSQIQEFNKDIL